MINAKEEELSAKFGEALVKHTWRVPVDPSDKAKFDQDHAGRAQTMAWMEELAITTYAPYNMNIAIMNMDVELVGMQFERPMFSGLVKVGNGGGFRITVFAGSGFFQIGGDSGINNWRASGNLIREGTYFAYQPVPFYYDLPALPDPGPDFDEDNEDPDQQP